jgi:hypothetical protein
VSAETRLAVGWWLNPDNVLPGVPLKVSKENMVQIFCDASTQGWGGHLEWEQIQGDWTPTEKLAHINVQEMWAVQRTLLHFQNRLKGRTVLVNSDNLTVVAYLRRQGGTKSKTLFLLTQALCLWLQSQTITLISKYIPGKLNVIADQLSRKGQILPTEWGLHPRVLSRLWLKWEKPFLDLFATRHNNKLPIYVSPVPDQKAWAVDALSIAWENLYVYAFPPTAILCQVLKKLAKEDCIMLLIAPLWPKQIWFPELLDLLIDTPVRLPVFSKLLKQPQSDAYHQNPTAYNLHAWRLSSNLCSRKGFLQKLHREWSLHRNNQVSMSMRESGNVSPIGVLEGIQIPYEQMYL